MKCVDKLIVLAEVFATKYAEVSDDTELKVGDWVRLKNQRQHVLYQIHSELAMGDKQKWFKVWPYDPIRGMKWGLVLYKNKKPTNYVTWARQHNGVVDFNSYTEANGGATSFEWERPFSIPASSLEKTEAPDQLGTFYQAGSP